MIIDIFSFKKKFLQKLAIFVLGTIIGAVLSTISIGHHIDKLYSEREDLKAKLTEREEQIKTLEEKVSQAKNWLAVKEIEIVSELPDKEFPNKQKLQLGINDNIKKMVRELRGKRVKDLDPQVVWSIVEDRIIEISSYSFQIEIKSILISEKIIFHIYAKLLPPVQQEEPV